MFVIEEYVSFPGLGIEPFHIDPVAFTIFGRDVMWYGVLITLGMLLAVGFAFYAAKHEKIKSDDIYDLAITAIVSGVLGARLYYVIFSWSEYSYVVTEGTFWEKLGGTLYNIIAIWDGGLAIYGGVLAGLFASFIFCRVKKIKFMKIADMLAACVLFGQVVGRWGNFINVEAYGYETTGFLRMGIHHVVSDAVISEKFVHPTFLYESLWNLVLLVFLAVTYKKKKFDGQHFATYLLWYGFGRTFLELLRTDSLMIGSFRISHLVGIASVIIGIVLFIVLPKLEKKNAAMAADAPVIEEITIEPKDAAEENKLGITENEATCTEENTTPEE